MLMEIIIHPSDVVLMLNHLDLLYSPTEVWSNKTTVYILCFYFRHKPSESYIKLVTLIIQTLYFINTDV